MGSNKGNADPNRTVVILVDSIICCPSPKTRKLSLPTQSPWKVFLLTFYLIPHPNLGKRPLSFSSCYTATGIGPAQLPTTREAGQVPNSPSSTCCCLPVTLVPQDKCTGGIKDKTFHAHCSTAEDPSLVLTVQEQA